MTQNVEQSPNPWSREAHEQRTAEQYVPHETETFRGKPVLNFNMLDPVQDRVYVNLPILRKGNQMDEGWTQIAEGISDATDERRPIMLMTKPALNEDGTPMLDDKGNVMQMEKWVDVQKALELAKAYREQGDDAGEEESIYVASAPEVSHVDVDGSSVDIDALAPAAALNIIEALDTEIDQRSAEIAEEEPRLTEEQAEMVGEEVLDAVDVQRPLEESPLGIAEMMNSEPVAAEAADTEGPTTAAKSDLSIAEMMQPADISAEERERVKFDIAEAQKAAAEREASRLVPEKELREFASMAHEILRQNDIIARNREQGADQGYLMNIQHGLEGHLVSSARKVVEQSRSGSMGKFNASLMEGLFIGSARSGEGLNAIDKVLEQSGLFESSDELRKIKSEINTLHSIIARHGAESREYGLYSQHVESLATRADEPKTEDESARYGVLLGMLIGTRARVGRDGAMYGSQALDGVMSRVRRLQRPSDAQAEAPEQ